MNFHKPTNDPYPEAQSFQELEYLTGTCKWFDTKKGFGFVIPDTRTREVFIHINQLKKSGINDFREGDKIRFVVAEFKGRKQCEQIEMI